MAWVVLVAATAGAEVDPGRGHEDPEEAAPKVGEVSVVGNENVSSGRILGRIATQESNRFLFFGAERRLELGVVAEDAKRIVALYRDEGFWATRVETRILPSGDGEVEVRFEVDEGPPAIVQAVLVTGMEGLPRPEVERVLSGNPIRVGERWTLAAHRSFKETIRQRLEEEGHATASVTSRVEVEPERGAAIASYEVEPGPVYRVGDIEVIGNLLVPDRRVLAATETVLQSGDRYSPTILREAQAEVFALGVFSTAVASIGKPDPETARVPVFLTVREADFLRLRLGAGAGIEQSYQQVRVSADFAHLDLFRGLQRLEFHNELAYRFLFTTAEVGSGFAGRSSLQFTQPDVIGNKIDLAARAIYERELTLSYVSQSIRGSFGLPIRFRRWLYFVPSYNLQRYFGVRTFTSPVVTGRPLPPVNCPNGCTFSFLEQRLVADRRSDPLEPRSGWFGAIGLQEGGGPLGGSFDWIRLVPEARTYLPLGPSWVLALRLELGYLVPLGTVQSCLEQEPSAYDLRVRCSPIVSRFFGGGAAGFRGVGAGRLSPLQAVVQGSGSDRRTVFVPLGGDSSLLATTEFRWFFARNWAAVFFLDVGNVGATPTDAFDSAFFQYAAGSGVRIRTPVGPVRLDVGYRFLHRHLEVVNSAQTAENSFIDWFAIFLSIGEAF